MLCLDVFVILLKMSILLPLNALWFLVTVSVFGAVKAGYDLTVCG
jgi:hypothetical protein